MHLLSVCAGNGNGSENAKSKQAKFHVMRIKLWGKRGSTGQLTFALLSPTTLFDFDFAFGPPLPVPSSCIGFCSPFPLPYDDDVSFSCKSQHFTFQFSRIYLLRWQLRNPPTSAYSYSIKRDMYKISKQLRSANSANVNSDSSPWQFPVPTRFHVFPREQSEPGKGGLKCKWPISDAAEMAQLGYLAPPRFLCPTPMFS